MATIAAHLKFALGGAIVEVFRQKPTEPLLVCVWRDGAIARIAITPKLVATS
jgi:hypothetical protein